MEAQQLEKILGQIRKESETTTKFDNLSDPDVLKQHYQILSACANARLAKQFKEFVVDEYNRDLIRFLLYYFNDNQKAEEVFPDKDYKVYKNLLICGEVGVGKTLLFDAFTYYLKKTYNPNAFENISVTQMMNYYKINNHLDRYTFNEENSKGFKNNPVNVCLNDIGLQTHLHFGTDTKVLVMDFFHARNEIWTQYGKFAHITTNLTPKEIKTYLDDEYGRLVDRLKTYNIIHLTGQSRR